jgi:hypothetical protein
MRVNISEIGSDQLIVLPSPACLGHAGDLSGHSQLAETQTAELELAHKGARTTAA